VQLYDFSDDYVQRLRDGDPWTEEHFVRYFNELLLIKLRNRLRSIEMIDDVRQEVFVLYYAIRDDRTPLYSKLPAFFSLVYLLSPIDLIPDFIPLFGYLDDLIIVPLLFHISFRLLPAMDRARAVPGPAAHVQPALAKTNVGPACPQGGRVPL